jgi:MerR HTH family regulatory protein
MNRSSWTTTPRTSSGPFHYAVAGAYNSQVAVSRQDLLEPIDLADHLDKVELYLGQVCAIAGISKMQLDYWTNKAQIPTKGRKQRIYDADALETVMLIKQAKDKGLNLGAAIDAARKFREQKASVAREPETVV